MSAVACLACGGVRTTHWADARDVEYITSGDVFAYWRCADCDTLSIDPVPEDRLREIYPPNYYAYASPDASLVQRIKRALDRRNFRSLLAAVPGARLSVLDVGGGAGWELAVVRAADARVDRTMVVDLDPGAQAIAEANGHGFACCRIEDFRSEERFDAILMLNLIEHVRDPGAVLTQARALLASGGRLLVKTPNHDALDARVFRHRSWAGLHCPRHWAVFTAPGFAHLAARSGLRVVSSDCTQGAPFWAASVLAWLSARGLASVTAERPAVFHPMFGPLAAAFAAFDFARRPFAKTSQLFVVLARDDAP